MQTLLSQVSTLAPANRWHANVDRIAGNRLPADGASDFPWDELQACTDLFLEAERPSRLQQDTLLAGLIKNHGNRVVALAACAHALSRSALRDAFGALDELAGEHPAVFYHGFVVYHWGTKSITEHDMGWTVTMAKLTSFSAPLNMSQLQPVLEKARLPGMPRDVTLQSRVKALLHTTLMLRLASKGYQCNMGRGSAAEVAKSLHDGLSRLTFREYYHWTLCLPSIYGQLGRITADYAAWAKCLASYRRVLEDLERSPNHTEALFCIYTCVDEPTANIVQQILTALQSARGSGRLEMLHLVIAGITDCRTETFRSACRTVTQLANCPLEDLRLCQEVVRLSNVESLQVAAIKLAIIVRRPGITHGTMKTLKYFSESLHFPTDVDFAEGNPYFLDLVDKLMRDAQMLADLYHQLRVVDKHAVTDVMARLKIQEPISPLEDEIDSLPGAVLEHVEQVDDTTVEIRSPTSKFNALQRHALGLRTQSEIVVRLRISDSGDGWSSFCVHSLGGDEGVHSHRPCKLKSDKSLPLGYCGHEKADYLAHIVGEQLLARLSPDRTISLYRLYKGIEDDLKHITSRCPNCQEDIGAKLYRPTSCARRDCRLNRISLLDRLPTEESVATLLLASVAAAVSTTTAWNSKPEMMELLLPDLPGDLREPTQLMALTKEMSQPRQDNPMLILLHQYSCTTIGGFLLEARGSWRIPNLPGVHQYLVADNPVGVTAAFAKHDHIQPRHVLFHGTSLSRLAAILTHGLKVCSNNPHLMVNGAGSGAGIYLAEEPSTSVHYAIVMPRIDNTEQRFANYFDKGVLLGVEYAGNDFRQGCGVHVATDPTRLLVRYVFLIPPRYQTPPASHVQQAMLSNFQALRGGLQ
ncbi:hypothetical protein LTR56_009154 [Elasticomyces elasticus]|nr:hypothetical protein LTR56_009154 [Elasticomyces elasticus]